MASKIVHILGLAIMISKTIIVRPRLNETKVAKLVSLDMCFFFEKFRKLEYGLEYEKLYNLNPLYYLNKVNRKKIIIKVVDVIVFMI